MNRALAAVATVGLALFLAACGGAGGSDASTLVTPTVAPAVQSPTSATATSPRPAPTATAITTTASAPATSSPTVAAPTSVPTAGSGGSPSEAQLLARGKLIFEKEAGGLGCAYCHGLDGRGVGPAQITAANIRGKDEGTVRAAIQGGVAMMSFIKLSDDEITAVAAYLQYLAAQP